VSGRVRGPNKVNKDGWTSLKLATTRKGHADVVAALEEALGLPNYADWASVQF